ncbi:L-glyceraldehyde 3-phosphate reductase [Actinomadura rugatobispora]|uniref:L-glyceraldehyde 3-phosphate reductase n=1 Tax=Actinomadura rugatobispora TaxID=1994 RepID=A0ABW1A7J8_9ACTN|nr:L-glyceraldehyde 3-phosphate reductase [Actinomadura rugatobispora]
MEYRRCGRSGLDLPVLSLGLWQNFGRTGHEDRQRALVRHAFDNGMTHFDLANNYGPPPGSAEELFGRILRTDLAGRRDEIVVATKAGYEMWPGRYGTGGSRKHMLASLDASLRRLGLDYVDIFYSHRTDPSTPIEETMSALETAVRQGKAIYAGVSSYSADRTSRAVEALDALAIPLLVHQASYSMLNRWIEDDLLDVLEGAGAGCIGFSPLAQGLLTDRYLNGVPAGSRAARSGPLNPDRYLTGDNRERVRALNKFAAERHQTLAQMALSWALRDPRMTSVVVGASSVSQLDDSLRCLDAAELTNEELAEIDRYATDGDVDIWSGWRLSD